MKLITYLIALVLFLAFTVENVEARKRKQYFNQAEIVPQFNITHPIEVANFLAREGNEILILGESKQQKHVAALYIFDQINKSYDLYAELEIPKTIIAFDLFTDARGFESIPHLCPILLLI